MGLILDSSILISAERQGVPFADVLGPPLASEPVAMAALTASELLHGVHRAAATARQRSQRQASVERLLATIPVLPTDLVVARVHARIAARLASKGATVGVHDQIIGATALAHALDVVTRDARSFPKIPGLKVHLR